MDSVIPAIYDEVTGANILNENEGNREITCNGINIHHNHGGLDVKRFSAGCMIVKDQYNDWVEYMTIYGRYGNYDGPWSTTGDYVGKIIIERCIDISIDVNIAGKDVNFCQEATFNLN